MTQTHYLRHFYNKSSPLLALDVSQNQLLKPMMTRNEASKLIEEISGATAKIFTNVVLLVSKRDYLAVGFKSPTDCLRKKIKDISSSYVSRLLAGSEIYLKLDPKLKHLHKVSEATFRPLQKVSDDEAKTVWHFVLEQYANKTKRINSRHIVKAMNALNINTTNSRPAINIKISRECQSDIQKYAINISQSKIFKNVHSRAEWEYFAKLIYRQLLEQCRFDDDHQSNAKQAA